MKRVCEVASTDKGPVEVVDWEKVRDMLVDC